jgi:hypothetical protein
LEGKDAEIVKACLQGPANPIWRTFGLPCRRNEWQLDSGQVLIDKRGQNGMNLAALIAAARMQEDHAFWFRISGGVSQPPYWGIVCRSADPVCGLHRTRTPS